MNYGFALTVAKCMFESACISNISFNELDASFRDSLYTLEAQTAAVREVVVNKYLVPGL
jgi:hypothetical protein